MSNFHVPSTDYTHLQLREEAARAQVPATLLERRAISIASYATEMAGTDFDLDRELESAAVELLVKNVRAAE